MIVLPEPKIMKPIPEIPNEPQPPVSKLHQLVNQPVSQSASQITGKYVVYSRETEV